MLLATLIGIAALILLGLYVLMLRTDVRASENSRRDTND